MTELDYDFPLAGEMSSRALIDFLEAGDDDQLTNAITEEARAFAASTPSRIDRGLVTAEDAKAYAALIEAIALDLQTRSRRAGQWREWLAGNRLDQPRPMAELLAEHPAPKPWADKVALLRALIEARRKSLPDDVAKGRATIDQARTRIEALEALHALYWCEGFAFDGDDTALRAHLEQLLSRLAEAEAA